MQQPQPPKSKGKHKTSYKKKDKSAVKCFKCGQTGHYANCCKAKIQQKLNELALDDEIQLQILQMLSEDSSISSRSDNELAALYSSNSDSESDSSPEICFSKHKINQISEEANYRKTIVEMKGLDTSSPSINVLTKSEQNMSNIADQITNPEMKLKYLELYYQQQKKEEIGLPPKHYSMKEVYKRIQNTTEEKPITIQDLKIEVNALKVEIKHLQTANIAFNADIKKN